MGMYKSVVCFFILMVIIAMLVSLVVYVILYAGSTTRLEWIDQDGRGNGSCHELMDNTGKHCMSFRLCDYSNTNNVYQLLIFRENDECCIDRNTMDISILRFSEEGDLLSSYKITSLYDDTANGLNLPHSCSPTSHGETLLIKVVVCQLKSQNMRCRHSTKRKIELKARLICEKVRHFPSV